MEIRDLLLSLTNFCLGSCVYCNLKSLTGFNYDSETRVKDVERVLKDPLLEGLKNMHITGGEPLLTPKTFEVFKLIKRYQPDIRINTPTSGFFPYLTQRYLKKLWALTPQLRVDISLDGPWDIHEKTRGKDTFKQVMKTVELLRPIAAPGKLQLQFTLMETNYEYIKAVYDLAKSMDIGFYVTFPHWGTRFGHKEDKRHDHSKEFIDIVDRQLKETWLKERPLNRRTWGAQKALWEGRKVYCDCDMGKYSLDVDPLGNVYPCMVYREDQVFGNVKENTLTEIFSDQERVNRVFSGIERKTCQPCLMPCCPWKRNFTIDGRSASFE